MKQPALHEPPLQYFPVSQEVPSSAFDQLDGELASLQTWQALPGAAPLEYPLCQRGCRR